jgi:hypothetical protein
MSGSAADTLLNIKTAFWKLGFFNSQSDYMPNGPTSCAINLNIFGEFVILALELTNTNVTYQFHSESADKIKDGLYHQEYSIPAATPFIEQRVIEHAKQFATQARSARSLKHLKNMDGMLEKLAQSGSLKHLEHIDEMLEKLAKWFRVPLSEPI